MDENTYIYKDYVLYLKEPTRVAFRNKSGDFVVFDEVDKGVNMIELFTETHETFVNQIYILRKKESPADPTLYFEFIFTPKIIDVSLEGRVLRVEEKLEMGFVDWKEKYGVHETGYAQYLAICKAIDDGIIFYIGYLINVLFCTPIVTHK